jgi:hypothetical protein
MAAKKDTSVPQEIVTDILKVTTGQFDCCIVGTSPLILNRMSEKAKHELLMPKGRKTAIEKALSLKHQPVEEYRASAYTLKDPKAPTLLALLSTSFKGAIRSAALDMPGAKKAQIGRLTYIEGEFVGIYGVSKLFMSVTRSADFARTPDIRTRAIVPEWATRIRITFVQPLIKVQAVANLLAAAGITIGVGDWRPEKGSGSYGQFKIVDQDDADYLRIINGGGRKAQEHGLEKPEPYDSETEELLTWFESERKTRTLKGAAA